MVNESSEIEITIFGPLRAIFYTFKQRKTATPPKKATLAICFGFTMDATLAAFGPAGKVPEI